MTTTGGPKFDHLAVGVEEWAHAYPRFATELGGQWSHGGDAGGYAPFQLVYRHGMRLEFLSPTTPEGFMRRFLDRTGPGPHHITFKVPSLDDYLEKVAALGINTLGGRHHMPYWQEAFLHPKECGMGTLIQFVQADEEELNAVTGGSKTPVDFPTVQSDQQAIAWVGLTANSLEMARSLFIDILGGFLDDCDEHWLLIRWGPGRTLLVRDSLGVPGPQYLWGSSTSPGVSHVLVGDPSLSPRDLQFDDSGAFQLDFQDTTRIPVWIVAESSAHPDWPAGADPVPTKT